jgi:hypothetical protein
MIACMRRWNSNDCIRSAFTCIFHSDTQDQRFCGSEYFRERIEFLERMLHARALLRITLTVTNVGDRNNLTF